VLTWGASGGGLNAVLLSERIPDRIDGVLAMCGPVAGGAALFDQLLDLGFTVRTLLEPELEVVRPTDPQANLAQAHQVITSALQTPDGRARLSLANAFASVPGWSRALQPRSTDVAEQIRQQTRFVELVYDALVWGDLRADLETQAGGNPSGNVGIDYRRLLARTSERGLVEQAYRDAGLDLSADLDRLAEAPRIVPEGHAVRWLTRYGTPTGRGHAPVVTLHPIGDGVAPEHERTFAAKVEPSRLRQLYVNRGGHCQHTAAEELTALRVLEDRVDTGHWSTTAPDALNATASRFGPEFHGVYDWMFNEQGTSRPAFTRHNPRPLPRVA
jgi:pimeloyl-ACP methyl ester carboxylesterase